MLLVIVPVIGVAISIASELPDPANCMKHSGEWCPHVSLEDELDGMCLLAVALLHQRSPFPYAK